jgi:mannosyltransferase OCH1-like enzyme
MIPKIIHYCWFGTSGIPDHVNTFVETWRMHNPDYQIKCWSEENIDISDCVYAQEALEHKKWAFLSDYIRLLVLAEYGGIYLDTDVECLKSFDALLTNMVFFGFEDDDRISTATIGAIPNHPLFAELVNNYKKRKFYIDCNKFDYTTNVKYITQQLVNNYNLYLNGKFQVINSEICIYPQSYFSPISFEDKICIKNSETYSIHHFEGSWMSPKAKFNIVINQKIKRIFGKKIGNLLAKTFNRMFVVFTHR